MVKEKKSASLFYAITFCVLHVLLVGCTDPELDRAGAFAAALVGSEDYSVAILHEAAGDVVELNVPDANWDARFADEDIASTCALAFYNQLPNPGEVSFIRMVIEKNGNILKRTFSDDELKLADRCIDRVTDYFQWHPRMGVDSIRPLVDIRFFPDSSLAKMSSEISARDVQDNAFKRAEYIGFQMDTIANISVLKLKLVALYKQSRQRFDAFVGTESERLVLVVPSDQ